LAKHQTLIAPEHIRVLRASHAEARLADAPPVETFVEERDLTVGALPGRYQT
jgi:hypothetical protein